MWVVLFTQNAQQSTFFGRSALSRRPHQPWMALAFRAFMHHAWYRALSSAPFALGKYGPFYVKAEKCTPRKRTTAVDWSFRGNAGGSRGNSLTADPFQPAACCTVCPLAALAW